MMMEQQCLSYKSSQRSAGESLPVFSPSRLSHNNQDLSEESSKIRGLVQRSMKNDAFVNSSTSIDYSHCGIKVQRSSQPSSRSSPRPKTISTSAQISEDKVGGRRVQSMRISSFSNSRDMPHDAVHRELLNLRDDSHPSLMLKHSMQYIGHDLPSNSHSDFSVPITSNATQVNDSKVDKLPTRHNLKNKSTFKMVAQKIVRAFSKEKFNTITETEKNVIETQKSISYPTTAEQVYKADYANSPFQGQYNILYQDEFETDDDAMYKKPSHAFHQGATNSSFVDPLEVKARELEEEAKVLGTSSDLLETLARTSKNGDCACDALEMQVQFLRTELVKQMDEKKQLALDMAQSLRERLCERMNSEEDLRRAKAEIETKVRMMERKEISLRNKFNDDIEEVESKWSSKYEHLKSKEIRTKERLKEIAREKVALQKEIFILNSKKDELLIEVSQCQENIKSLEDKANEALTESTKLREALVEASKTQIVHDGPQKTISKDEYSIMITKYKLHEKENLKSQNLVRTLQNLCQEHEKTIQGLRYALEQQINIVQIGRSGDFLVKLHREILRLTGVEQSLRKEVESNKKELQSFKRENFMLVHRLSTLTRKLESFTHKVDLSVPCERVITLNPCANSSHDDTSHIEARDSKARSTEDHGYCKNECQHGESEALCEEVKMLSQIQAELQCEIGDLHNTLSMTNKTIQDLQSQLIGKEKQMESLHDELNRVKGQRDDMQKEADFMGREAIRLSTQVNRLTMEVERLDEDVMVKDGQLSILKQALQDGSK